MAFGKMGTAGAVLVAGVIVLNGIYSGLRRVRESQATATPTTLPSIDHTRSKLTASLTTSPSTTRPAPLAPAVAAQVPLGVLSPDQLFTFASPSVALVEVKDRLGKPKGQGSGFFVTTDGLLVTNFHVIEGGHSATVHRVGSEKRQVAGVVAADRDADLAVLQVNVAPAAVPVLALADAPPSIGTRVFAIGNPLGLTNTFSDGLVSGMRSFNKDEPTLMQISAPISPGSSGGPLLTADGRVVGVTTAGIFGPAQNLNFVVPAEHVHRLLRERSEPRPIAEMSKLKGRVMPLDRVAAMIDAKDYGPASDTLRDLADVHDADPRYHLLRGRLQEECFRNPDIAQDDYRRATRLSPDYAPAHARLGLLLLKRGDYPEAIASFRKLAELEPRRVDAYRGAGDAHARMDEHTKALAFFDHALKLDKTDVATTLLRAKSLVALKRDGDALAAYRTVLANDPKSPDALNGIGDVYFLGGRMAEAKEAFTDVIRQYPLNARAHLQLGQIARRAGDRATAQAHWSKTAGVDPRGPDGRAARKLLGQLIAEGHPDVDAGPNSRFTRSRVTRP